MNRHLGPRQAHRPGEIPARHPGNLPQDPEDPLLLPVQEDRRGSGLDAQGLHAPLRLFKGGHDPFADVFEPVSKILLPLAHALNLGVVAWPVGLEELVQGEDVLGVEPPPVEDPGGEDPGRPAVPVHEGGSKPGDGAPRPGRPNLPPGFPWNGAIAGGPA